ncbi:MAG: hypothetical protein AAF493_07210 [Pseudomonadota bacterium]
MTAIAKRDSELAGFDAERMLRDVRRTVSVVDRTLAGFSDEPVSAYVESLRPNPTQSFQPRDDFFQLAKEKAEPVLGDRADDLAAELERVPAVLTANHHGVDYFAQSVQGTLLFSLARRPDGQPRRTVPVLACAAVPLDNITYPLGMLLYGLCSDHAVSALPVRFPIFANRVRRTLVSAADGFDAALAERAIDRLQKAEIGGQIEPTIARAASDVVASFYLRDDVLALPRYVDQSMAVNSAVWQRMFTSDAAAPALACLEFEDMAASLAIADLANPKSLLYELLFDAGACEFVFETLDEQRACWSRAALAARLEGDHKGSKGGTVFFWGVSDKGRRVPLTLSDGGTLLIGCDTQGERWEVSLTPDALQEGLANRTLLPSLFTAFTVIGIARGIACLGAYFQAQYLPIMQQTICRALARGANPSRGIDAVSGVSTDGYLGGMQLVGHSFGDRGIVPAGPIEIIAGGGLGPDDLERMSRTSVGDAHLASLFDTITDVGLAPTLEPHWREALADQLQTLLPSTFCRK